MLREFLVGKPEEKRPLGRHRCVDRWIILIYILHSMRGYVLDACDSG
jgi:hypothetical protein